MTVFILLMWVFLVIAFEKKNLKKTKIWEILSTNKIKQVICIHQNSLIIVTVDKIDKEDDIVFVKVIVQIYFHENVNNLGRDKVKV